MTRLVLKTGHQEDACYNETEVYAQNVGVIISSIINMIGRAYVTTYGESSIFTSTS